MTGLIVIVILALCQGIKIAGVKSRYIPLVAILLGIIGSVFYGGISSLTLLAGVLTGLSSSGLYSSGKAMMGK